jgi:hypothetical protein
MYTAIKNALERRRIKSLFKSYVSSEALEEILNSPEIPIPTNQYHSMNSLHELQEWYLSQCNENWEHTYGVSIGTLDNPGWSLEVDLTGTNLNDIEFKELSYGVSKEPETSGHDWIHCKVKDHKFSGYGGPRKLEEIINVFLVWAKQNS